MSPLLRAGDRVAVVAPSGPVDADRLDRGVQLLRSWGLEVVLGAHVLERRAHLAGTDQQRASDVQDAWTDPEVAAVFAARGGSGAARLLPLLDWAAIARAPQTLLVGSSDITAMHQAVAARLGQPGVFGPMAATEVLAGDHVPDARTAQSLRDLLLGAGPARVPAEGPVLVPGRAQGVLRGGTLSLLAGGLATPWAGPSAAGAVVLLEDVEEPPYVLDRLLTQLLQAGWFHGVRGLVLGTWEACGPGALEVLAERLVPLGVPLLAGLPVGHGPVQRSVLLGAPVVLDADAQVLAPLSS